MDARKTSTHARKTYVTLKKNAIAGPSSSLRHPPRYYVFIVFSVLFDVRLVCQGGDHAEYDRLSPHVKVDGHTSKTIKDQSFADLGHLIVGMQFLLIFAIWANGRTNLPEHVQILNPWRNPRIGGGQVPGNKIQSSEGRRRILLMPLKL